jgi:amino acid adenylation domain-containing protein
MFIVVDALPQQDVSLLSELLDSRRLESIGVDLKAVAITDGSTALCWRDYIAAVARLAGALRSVGVGPGDRVGVRMLKSIDSFVAVHAILRAGAVMVPVDPLAPVEHAVSVLEDSGAAVLVADTRALGLATIVDSASITSVLLPGTDDATSLGDLDRVLTVAASAIAACEVLDPVAVGADAPAYVIYTSGSTGRPKGIVHTHSSALAYAVTGADVYGLSGADRLANIAPLHFDQSTFELYSAPAVGAAVLVVPDPVLRFPASLSKMIADQQITVWYSVPYLLEQLSQRGALAERDLSALRWVLFGGESFPPGQLAALMQQLRGVRFSNVYGPAEVNQCTMFHLDQPPTGDVVPIGRAWPAAELRVVDPDDPTADVADGQPGLLVVKTPTMMSHYWNRPDLTAAAFVDDEEGRWYQTGDLVSIDDDGQLVFLGRVDNQIKLRGHRIELEAIDAILRDLPEVSEATTVVRRPDDADDVIVAIVVAALQPADLGNDGDGLSVLRSHIGAALAERLPRYAVPGAIVIVDALPRTGTGKVDRGASAELLHELSSS